MGNINTKIPEGGNQARINVQNLRFVKGYIRPCLSLFLSKGKVTIPIAIESGCRNNTSNGYGDHFFIEGLCNFEKSK